MKAFRILSVVMLGALSLCGQGVMDLGKYRTVVPWPQLDYFPGSCKPGSMFTYTLGTPGANVYQCNPGGTGWVQASGSGNGATLPLTSNVLKGDSAGGAVPAIPGSDFSTPATNETVSGNRTFVGAYDASGATSTKPAKVGSLAQRPATCGAGELFLQTDAAAGEGLTLCTSTNVWKPIKFVGGASGKVTVDCSVNPCTIDVTPGQVPGLSEANTFTALNSFAHIKVHVYTGVPTSADCDESTEEGKFGYRTDGATGQKIYACKGTAGWEVQGGSGGGSSTPDTDLSRVVMIDEFAAPNYSGAIMMSSHSWYVNGLNHSPNSYDAGAWPDSGITSKFSIGTTSGNWVHFNLGGFAAFFDPSQHAGTTITGIYYGQYGGLTNVNVRVGFTQWSGLVPAITTPTDFIGAQYRNGTCTDGTSSDTAWKWRVRTTGTEVTTAITGAPALVNSGWIYFRFRVVTPGTVKMSYKTSRSAAVAWSTEQDITAANTGSMRFGYFAENCGSQTFSTEIAPTYFSYDQTIP